MIPNDVRIFVCVDPVDMRFGFDRLAQIARTRVGIDPGAGGALFVFPNAGARRLKVLWFERHGMCMLYKRLHRARFELPTPDGLRVISIDSNALGRLLAGHSTVRRTITEENKESSAMRA